MNLTVAKTLHNKFGKALLIAEFHDVIQETGDSLKVNSSIAVIPASEAEPVLACRGSQESF